MMSPWTRLTVAILASAALQACGGDGRADIAGATESPVQSDGAAKPVLTPGFTGTFGFRVPAQARTVGVGADGQGGIAVGARMLVRWATVVVFDESGSEIGRSQTDGSGLATYRPIDGSLAPIAVELRGNDGAEIFDLALDRWIPFTAGTAWRALVPAISANIGIGPLSDAWVARYEAQPAATAGGRVSSPKAGPTSLFDAPRVTLAELIRARGIRRADLDRAGTGLALEIASLARVAEALGFAIDRRAAVPTEVFNGLWDAPHDDLRTLVEAWRATTLSGGHRDYQSGGVLPDDGGIDLAMFYEVLASLQVPAGKVPGAPWRDPVTQDSKVLALADLLRLDLAADGVVDCANAGQPLVVEDTPWIQCFGSDTDGLLATLLARLGLTQT